jgi:hypothetical protein
MRSWNLGVLEVSGLGLRRDPRSGSTELIAVSDRTTTVVRLRADGAGRLTADQPRRRAAAHHRVRRLPDDLDSATGGSQWEGVAGDGAGRLAVLCERSSELLVISPEFRFERRIRLRHDGEGDGRAGLESVVLLRNGHVLAAKQRHPLQLLELGPAGDEPVDLTPSMALPAGRPAVLSAARELRTLGAWSFADPTLRSINDLAARAGCLYAISSTSRRITRIRLPATEPLLVESWWPLPADVAGSRGAKAEGLIVDDQLGVLVGVDSRDDEANLYWLGRSCDGPPDNGAPDEGPDEGPRAGRGRLR